AEPPSRSERGRAAQLPRCAAGPGLGAYGARRIVCPGFMAMDALRPGGLAAPAAPCHAGKRRAGRRGAGCRDRPPLVGETGDQGRTPVARAAWRSPGDPGPGRAPPVGRIELEQQPGLSGRPRAARRAPRPTPAALRPEPGPGRAGPRGTAYKRRASLRGPARGWAKAAWDLAGGVGQFPINPVAILLF